MKKQLLGTTTLVAAGLLIAGGPGQEAFAAEPITAGFGGTYTVVLQGFDQGDTGGGLRDHAIDDTGEIQFSGSTELDNGITVAVRIEYEAQNQGAGSTIVDERYMTFSGGFGMLRIGSDDNAASAMHYQDPVAAWEFGTNSPSHAVLSNSTNALTSFVGTYQFTGGDAQKIIYFTPRMNGVQLGISYQPDDSTQEGPSAVGQSDNETGVFSNQVAVGVNYQGSFDQASISASFGYLHGQEESELATTEGLDSFSAGLTVGWDAFALGAAYKHTDNGTAANGDLDVLGVGFTHSTGDLTWGLNYSYGNQETGAGTDDNANVFGINANYALGPGISFIAGVKYYDYDTDTAGRAAPEGTTGGIGVVTYF